MINPAEPRPLQSRIVMALVALSLMISCLSIYLFYSKSRSIVYVDSRKLIQNYHGMESSLREMNGKIAQWHAKIDTIEQEVEALSTEYKAEESGLSDREKSLMKELISLKKQQLAGYRQIIDDKIEDENHQITSLALSKINAYIKQYGVNKGYSIVITGTEYGNMIYTQESTDITDELLNALNVEYKQVSAEN